MSMISWGKEAAQKMAAAVRTNRRLRAENADLLARVYALENDRVHLRRRIEELETSAQPRQFPFVVRAGVYYEDGSPDAGPFCPNCWNKDGVRLRIDRGVDRNYWYCRACKSSIRDPDRGDDDSQRRRPSRGF